MTPTVLFYIIVGILVLNYVFERILEYLNSTKLSPELPNELQGIYDPEKYKKSQNYEKENQKLAFVSSSFNLLAILIFLSLDGFGFVDQLSRQLSGHNIIIPLLFFGILFLALDIINLPFSLYDTFVIEEKYGFNKTTVKTFIADKIKSWFLMVIIGGGLLALIVWFYNITGQNFWIYAWILIIAFSGFMTMFYTHLILPLFNKLTPMEEGELKNKIFDFSRKAGFGLKNIFVMDGSKRSSKANAFFSGLGKKRRIVLFDTLIKELQKNEIVAVLAHEIGHYKKKHTLMNLAISTVETGITLFILSLFIDNPQLSKALGAENASFHIGLIAFGLLYSPISTILGILTNIISRKNEFEADNFAAQFKLDDDLINALKKLSVNNLSNLTPHPAYVFVNYSHPPLLSRIKNLKN